MFPLYDSIKAPRFAFLNWLIIAANIYVFYLELTTPNLDAFISQWALIPSQVSVADPTTLLPFITAMFLHGGFLHIISNLWFLKVFGDNVEGHMNPISFLLLYFGSGLVGNILQFVLMPNSTIPMLGASGAIAGVLGAYFILFPQAKIKSLITIPPFITLANVPAVIMLGYWIVLQVFSGFGSLGTSASQGGVAFFAHIGGFITGLILAKLFTSTPTPSPSNNVIEGQIIS